MRALCSPVARVTKLPFYHHSLPLLSLKSPNHRQIAQQFPSLHLRSQNPKPSQQSLIKASMSSSASTEIQTKPFSVLFVCLGNICRSPAAEGVFRDLVKKRGIDSNFNIDSAGTIGYHEGDQADPRMRGAARRRGIEITSISRPIRPSDFIEFDLILAMDQQNRDDILRAFERWKFREALPEDAYKKVRLMCSYCKKHDETEVPDPYYGGPQGFEKVLDLLEDACESLLDGILAEHSHI
ncbi:Phosphotyrosine protein phosphatase I [Dillenia turbinata]|uniref:acid phosphatase n=1 Tax=Dillenia turbinata TaxID=194707 RepID=A0AAN8ZFI6_9MAGN